MSVNQPHPPHEDLFAYRDGELKADRRVVIEAHVLGCHTCRELIDDVSRMEADLSVGAPVPKDAYFERLSEQVMAKVAAADTAPSHERRRPEAEAEWEEKRELKPKLPWFALVSTASAAAAVIVVGVLLVREGAVWRRAPSVAVLERSAPDAARSRAPGDSESARSRAGRREAKKREDRAAPPPASIPSRGLKAAVGGEKGKLDAKNEADELNANKQVALGSGAVEEKPKTQENLKEGENQQRAGQAALEKLSSARDKDSSLRAAAPEASQALAPVPLGAEPVGESLKALLQRYGLPLVWGPGVSDDVVLRAEPALRNLYRIGGASSASDSARVRLYLAESARVRAGAAPDSAAIDEIVHHYRRAIRLAGNDAELRRVAAERLQDFLNELGDEPELHSP